MNGANTEHPSWTDCDANKLDDGIRDFVIELRSLGFRTFTSCEGGDGHAFTLPTVRMEVDHGTFATLGSTEKRLVEFMRRTYPHVGFYTSITRAYGPRCTQPPFVELSYWGCQKISKPEV